MHGDLEELSRIMYHVAGICHQNKSVVYVIHLICTKNYTSLTRKYP